MDEEIERLLISVRADTAGFSRDVAAMRAELGAVLSALLGPDPAPASSADLARLMERFPDGRGD